MQIFYRLNRRFFQLFGRFIKKYFSSANIGQWSQILTEEFLKKLFDHILESDTLSLAHLSASLFDALLL